MPLSTRTCLLFLSLIVPPGNLGTLSSAGDSESLTYEEHIRPILRAHCFDCHGATDEVEGSLDLRLVRFMTAGGDSGPAIVAGDPAASLLLERILSGEMPPGEARVPDEEIDLFERWIAGGAATVRPEPDEIGPGLGITPEERAFWSFQPIQRPEIRDFEERARVRTAIDALLLDAMPEGLSFSPDAERFALIKRVYFDLIGLPPTANEIARWLGDERDDWYERLIDELLKSEHYGERWARHWLDVAGYADSEGYTTNDAERPWTWRFRDYVIRSFNEDKPFDRFLVEQLAGDELAGPIEGDLTPEQIELLTATGYLRMAADGTGSGADNPESRNQVMADTLKIVSTSLLGLSIGCAQCHDHRYDPIPQTDYYALRAVFEPALDWQAWRSPQQRRVSLYTEADRARAAEIEAEAQTIAAEKAEKQSEYMAQALDKELEKYEEPLRTQLREAYETEGGLRSEEQKALLKQYPSVNISPGVLYQYLPEAAEDLKTYDARIAEVRGKKTPEEFLRVLSEPAGHSPETRLFHRGDHQQPQQVVAPAGLTVASPEGAQQVFAGNNEELPTTGRRLAWARWLTGGSHPLAARVIVNRIWMHHFGQGIVGTPADFGRLGTAPSHPELLDYLADEFMSQGWSMKALHRLILTSTAWRQSSYRDPERDAIDPENRFYWRKSILRLEAESLRDRMLASAGRLDPTLFGPPVPIKEDDTGQVIIDGANGRRSLYIRVRRSQPVAMLQAFDAPVMQINCERRPVSTVATQSLMLMNSEGILGLAEELAMRASDESVPLASAQFAELPKLPQPASSTWSFGYGNVNEATGQTGAFTALTHWTGSQWQAGEVLPDPELGWVLLNLNGGHPDIPERAVIRRWTAPEDGVITITGTLSHGSENGNGIRGRVVSSQSGLAGEFTAFNGSSETAVAELKVIAGDAIDFVTDSQGDHNSDSFNWPVTIALRPVAGGSREFASTSGFHGPPDSTETLPAEIVQAWRLALCRQPTNDELMLAMDFLGGQLTSINDGNVTLPAERTATRQAMINLCQALLTCNEFLYVD